MAHKKKSLNFEIISGLCRPSIFDNFYCFREIKKVSELRCIREVALFISLSPFYRKKSLKRRDNLI